jgi:hypothetical protein
VGPIELLFIALAVMLGVVGVARGFLRELGVTTLLVFTIFMLMQFETPLGKGLDVLIGIVRVSALNGAQANLIRFAFYFVVIVGVALISYIGETLSFGGTLPKGPLTTLLGLVAGLWNGYLIFGSIWYYMHVLHYPISMFGLFQGSLSPFAMRLVQLLPESFIPSGGFLGLAAFLLIMRVIR